MNRWTLLAAILLIAASPGYSAEQELIKDKTDEINYSLGHQLGREVLKHQLEFRAQVLWQGVYDAVNNAEPFLPAEQMELILQQLNAPQSSVTPSSPPTVPSPGKAKTIKPAPTYRLKGQSFLAVNKTKEGVVTLPSGVQYKVLKEGEGQKPKLTDSVMVDYRSTDIDGKVFDSTSRLGASVPRDFKVNKLIPGLAETLPLMKTGAKWEIYIPTRMAFKDASPMAGQTVIYELELLEILPEFY